MARLDPHIRTLCQEGGGRLLVAEGRPVVLSSGSENRALTESPLERSEVRTLLAELRPAEENGPPDEGSEEFIYEAPSGRVQVRALVRPGTVRIQIRPSSDPKAGGASASTGAEAARDRPPGGTGPGGREADASSSDEEPVDPAAAAVDAAPEADSDAPRIERLFRKMVREGCSDLHVSAENPPLFRKDGEMVSIGEEPVLSAEETRRMLLEIAPEKNRREFEATHDTDFAYELPGVARFRCNLFLDRRGPGGVFRQIPAEIMTVEELGLPDAILDLCELKKGLVVVTGPTGSGKSTTLAAMIDYINRSRKAHVITIEDPIEFVHENKKCLINQREVGVHTEGFGVALRAALREDPDIVLVGEMRDLETVEIAMETAETGHLVFGTLHTNTAASTVDRVIDQFPADQQNQIRTMLAESLKGVVAQTLCRREEGGRVAAMEILVVTNAVSNLIREGKTFQIPSLMQTGSSAGMRTLNDALLARVQEGIVAPDEARRNAVDKKEFEQLLQRHGYGTA